MNDPLSFYIQRDSLLHRLNPLTKLTLVISLILLAYLAPFYWLPTILFLLVIIPLSFLGRVWLEFIRATARLLLPVTGFIFVMQAFFHPGGTTVIFQVWIFTITTESLSFAYQTATRVLVMISAFLILLLTTHPSQLMSDFTRRGAPSALSYIVTSSLQILPQMRLKANTIIDAQRSRGLETQGSLWRRVRALLPLVSPLVFGSLVDVEERAIAIEARAFNTPGPKTSLTDIPDSTSERILRWLLVLLVVIGIGSRLWLS